MKDGYKDVGDLYVQGDVLRLRNGKTIWVQVLNSFELEECRTAARVARARVVNALKSEESPESQIVRSQFRQGRRDLAIANLMSVKSDEISMKVAMEIESEPEWQEVLELITRASAIASRGPTDEEAEALAAASTKYVEHINDRMDEEVQLLRLSLEALDDDQLEQEVVDSYVKSQGDRAAMDEYRLTEMSIAARVCDAEWIEEEERWDHAIPLSERIPIWTKAEVRSLPEDLQQEIQGTLRKMNMGVNMAKDLAAAASSSDSSAPPSEEGASEASTPEEMSEALPGT